MRLQHGFFIGALALWGCESAPSSLPVVDSPRLTQTDVAVLRSAADCVRLRFTMEGQFDVVIRNHTMPVAPWTPPASLSEEQLRLTSPPRSRRPEEFMPPGYFTPAERAAWTLRNRTTHEVPDLGWPELTTTSDVGVRGRPTLTFGTPVYPTNTTAVVIATYGCGGACGYGMIGRLEQSGDWWLATSCQQFGIA
jgi:hypothetical protein